MVKRWLSARMWGLKRVSQGFKDEDGDDVDEDENDGE